MFFNKNKKLKSRIKKLEQCNEDLKNLISKNNEKINSFTNIIKSLGNPKDCSDDKTIAEIVPIHKKDRLHGRLGLVHSEITRNKISKK